MKEDFLHYVWQQQYFDKTDLRTTAGELLTIVRPGLHNHDAGPDFLSARLHLGEVEWNGAVEIHLRASDWHRHQHQHDPKYDQVVLHVVLHADEPVRRTNGSDVPALVLAGRLAPDLLSRYEQLLAAPPAAALPCAPLLAQVPVISQVMMVERALLERVEQKAAGLENLHQHLGGDWEATAYHALLAAFGFKKNTEPLQRLAKALPLPVVRRHRHDRRQLEALLFGQAGFLAPNDENRHDLFVSDLRAEYDFLAHKYQLQTTALALHDWNFLRLRPANFPPVRLAQLAAVLHARPALFDALLTAQDVPTLEQFLAAPVSEYWQGHTRPGRVGKVPHQLGRSSAHLLITNVVVPLRVAYARHIGQVELVEQALALLAQLPAERNAITATYDLLGFHHRTAADSQGLLALHHGYCAPRQCLRCAIGSRILQPKSVRR